MIIFINNLGQQCSLEEDEIKGVTSIPVFGSNRRAYFLITVENIQIEITEESYKDFLNAGYQEV